MRTVRVDATAPAAPEITAPAQDSAQSSATVTLSGSAEPSADIAVSEGVGARGTAKADAGGAWTVAIANVPEGAHEYTATATDEAVHTSAPSADPARARRSHAAARTGRCRATRTASR